MEENMKLKKIKLYGLKSISEIVEVSFSDLNVSVIYGDNGCGKTTLLRVINAVLQKDDSILLNENVEKVDIVYENNDIEKAVHIKKEEVKTQISEDFDKENGNGEEHYITRTRYNWDEVVNSDFANVSSILFGVNRGITNTVNISAENLYNYISRSRFSNCFRNRDEIREFCHYLSRNINMNQRRRRGVRIKDSIDFSDSVLTIDNVEMNAIEQLLIERYSLAKQVSVMRVQKALFDTLADACNSTKDDNIDLNQLKELLIKNKEKLINTLNQIESNTLSDKIISILSENDIEIIVKECDDNPLLTKLIVNMSMEIEKEEGLLQSVRTLKEVFDDYIGPRKSIEIDEDGVIIKFNGSDEKHTIANLSSGERHLLVLLTVFIIEGRERNILMIDEPEISLNLKWQRKLMPLLSELAPNAQIIVASHSPSIAKADSRYLVELR